MSGQSHYLGVRVHPQVAEAVGQLAEQSGRSVSDVVREALEARLAQSPQEAKPGAFNPASFNPYARVAAAARGSLDAQREITSYLIDSALSLNADRLAPDNEADTDELLRAVNVSLREALVYARLAASHGHPSDQLQVIILVSMLAEVEGENLGETADVIARVRWLSMQPGYGSDELDGNIDAIMREVSPEVLSAARIYSEAMTAAEGEGE